MEESATDLRYPIGPFEHSGEVTSEDVASWIADIRALPRDLRDEVTPLSAAQLNTPYRPDGWTVQQVVHHVADSHINSYVRFKWGLTEERPRIKAYYEERWAELPDYRDATIGLSLDLLDSLHARWAQLLESLSDVDLQREFVHPDSGPVTLARNIGIYRWHGRHHLAHIQWVTRKS